MEINHHILWIWAKEILGFNNKKLLRLVDLLGSIDAVYQAEDFTTFGFLTPKEQLLLAKKDLRSAWEIYGDCEENQIGILTLEDALYPILLKEISNPPSPLFFKGHLNSACEKPMLTIVGTRHCDGYGEAMAKEITSALGYCGFTIVCGIADGIDTFVCESILRTDGTAIAVLPYGLLSTKGHSTKYFRDILKNGALISEAFPRNPVHRYAYHERNRILSGLSNGTLVIQAPKRSGALMTANYAIEQNRDLFAVMANASAISEGSNKLIKDGCYPVTEYTDILQHYLPKFHEQLQEMNVAKEKVFSLQDELTEDKLTAYKRKYRKTLTDDERAVFDLLTTEECTTDYLIENAGIPMEAVMQSLTMLEFKGLAVSCPGSKFKVIL